MTITTTYNYSTPSNYTYDSDDITVASGDAKLVLQTTNTAYNEDFADDTDFTYDSDIAEFTGGRVQQKNTRPTDATLYASFVADEDSSWAEGSASNSLVGGATWGSGRVDLTGASGKRLYMPGSSGNFDTVGSAGCIRWTYRPNYNGNPTSTRQILEYDAVVGNNGAILISHYANQALIAIDLRDSSGTAHQLYASGFTLVEDQDHVFELNFDFDGTSRFFIDGTQYGSLNTSSWTRTASNGTFKWGGASGTGDFWIDDVILFSSVQHTSSHTGELPYTYYEYKYEGSSVVLPEMEHTGLGTLRAGVSFATTEANDPRYTIQVGRSGDYLYWDGAAWSVSDGTYAQANSETDFNTNFSSLDIDGEIYGQFKIIFTDSNTDRASVSDLTATVEECDCYPTTNPDILTNSGVQMDNLVSFAESATVAGSDAVGYTLSISSQEYYHDGADWAASDGTYAQSNTAAEINTNAADFADILGNGATVKINAFLHSDDGTTTPTLASTTVGYSFYSGAEDIELVTVYGYIFNNDTAVSGATLKFRTSAAFVDNNNVIDVNTSTTTRSNGYFEIDLPKTDDAGTTIDVTITYEDAQGWTKVKDYTINITASSGQQAFEDIIV